MAPFSSYKQDTRERLAAVEAHVENIYKLLGDLRDNHIYHLRESVERIEQLVIGRPTWLSATIVTILTAILAAILGYRYG